MRQSRAADTVADVATCLSVALWSGAFNALPDRHIASLLADVELLQEAAREMQAELDVASRPSFREMPRPWWRRMWRALRRRRAYPRPSRA